MSTSSSRQVAGSPTAELGRIAKVSSVSAGSFFYVSMQVEGQEGGRFFNGTAVPAGLHDGQPAIMINRAGGRTSLYAQVRYQRLLVGIARGQAVAYAFRLASAPPAHPDWKAPVLTLPQAVAARPAAGKVVAGC